MNNYKHVLNLAKDLQEEFGNKLTLFEALQIAAHIHHIEVVSEGLLVRSVNTSDSKPVALEAMAIAMGYNEDPFGPRGNILGRLEDISDALRKTE